MIEIGLGCHLPDEQIALLLEKGQKLVTCEPWDNLEKMQPGIPLLMLGSVGELVTVYDLEGNARGKATLVMAARTTFGDPSPELVSGMGFGTDVARFQSEYREFWQYQFPDVPLTAATVLLMSAYEKSS